MADVVIVGSGMCGAMTAHTLLSAEDRPKGVVVLEAREICSGASGRNAGHCRPGESPTTSCEEEHSQDETGLGFESAVTDCV